MDSRPRSHSMGDTYRLIGGNRGSSVHSRLLASQAAIDELRILRDHQEAMVEEVKQMVLSGRKQGRSSSVDGGARSMEYVFGDDNGSNHSRPNTPTRRESTSSVSSPGPGDPRYKKSRRLSGTVYSYPSPMHAILIQHANVGEEVEDTEEDEEVFKDDSAKLSEKCNKMQDFTGNDSVLGRTDIFTPTPVLTCGKIAEANSERGNKLLADHSRDMHGLLNRGDPLKNNLDKSSTGQCSTFGSSPEVSLSDGSGSRRYSLPSQRVTSVNIKSNDFENVSGSNISSKSVSLNNSPACQRSRQYVVSNNKTSLTNSPIQSRLELANSQCSSSYESLTNSPIGTRRYSTNSPVTHKQTAVSESKSIASITNSPSAGRTLLKDTQFISNARSASNSPQNSRRTWKKSQTVARMLKYPNSKSVETTNNLQAGRKSSIDSLLQSGELNPSQLSRIRKSLPNMTQSGTESTSDYESLGSSVLSSKLSLWSEDGYSSASEAPRIKQLDRTMANVTSNDSRNRQDTITKDNLYDRENYQNVYAGASIDNAPYNPRDYDKMSSFGNELRNIHGTNSDKHVTQPPKVICDNVKQRHKADSTLGLQSNIACYGQPIDTHATQSYIQTYSNKQGSNPAVAGSGRHRCDERTVRENRNVCSENNSATYNIKLGAAGSRQPTYAQSPRNQNNISTQDQCDNRTQSSKQTHGRPHRIIQDVPDTYI